MTLRDIFLSIIIAALIMALGTLGWQLLMRNAPSTELREPSIHHAAIRDSFSNLKAATGYVSQLHDELNNMVGHGDITLFTPEGRGWVILEEKMPSINTKLDRIKALGGTAPFLEDLDTFSRLLNLGLEFRDHQAMKFAHRIIHDLDYTVFESPKRESDLTYWGATITLEGRNSTAKRWLDARR